MTFSEQMYLTIVDKLVIGVVILVGGLWFNRLLEKFKHAQAQQLEAFRSDLLGQTESARTVRAAIGKLVKQLAVGNQSISWMAWMAKHTPKHLNQEVFSAYDKEWQSTYAEIVKARVMLAALDATAHNELGALVNKLYDLDVRVSSAKAGYADDPQNTRRQLSEFHTETLAFDDELLVSVTNVLRSFEDRHRGVKRQTID